MDGVADDFGEQHTSNAQPSKCTTEKIKKYFTKGELPDGNIKCEVDSKLFADDDDDSKPAPEPESE